ncbi:MAG: TolC family protein, partial [Bryobacteraceae bacterium]
SRSRYSQAVNTRQLQEELLKAEQAKFSYGTSTISGVIIVQRALVAAQTSEVGAAAAYERARISLDQVLGQTLEVNHVSVEEGLLGKIGEAAH